PASHVRYACRVNVSFLCSTSPPRDPHSFPTRRSSDLLRGTAGLQIRFSSFVEEEADVEGGPSTTSAPISPTNVLSSPLDGTSVLAPNVTVNQDTAAANQNETAIAVDPNNASRVVGAANDYVTRTWTCTISGNPCSGLGDGYSGTYYSNDGGSTWC